MSVVTISDTPEPEGAPTRNDAAFAHGEAVGEFRTHMSECGSKHFAHDVRETELESRIAAVEAAAASAISMAIGASVEASVAHETADEASEEAEEAEEPEDLEVVEMEMPDIPTESTEEPKKQGGFHLW